MAEGQSLLVLFLVVTLVALVVAAAALILGIIILIRLVVVATASVVDGELASERGGSEGSHCFDIEARSRKRVFEWCLKLGIV